MRKANNCFCFYVFTQPPPVCPSSLPDFSPRRLKKKLYQLTSVIQVSIIFLSSFKWLNLPRSPTSTFLPLAFLNFSFLHLKRNCLRTAPHLGQLIFLEQFYLFPGSTLPLPSSSASTSTSLLFIQVHLLAPLHRRPHPGHELQVSNPPSVICL